MNPLPAPKALNDFFLEARCRLLDLAAILDRVQRGRDAESLEHDQRLAKIREALAILHGSNPGRAERIQQLFSLEYDAEWERPKPRY